MMKMKKVFTYIASLAAALSLTVSCSLDSESPSTFDASIVFANYDLAEKAIFGITETMCEVNSYRGRFLPWYGFNTDIEWFNTFKPGDGKTDIAVYDAQTNNGQMNTASGGVTNNPWALMYSGIERANLAIEGIREYGNIENNEQMAYLLGEALTLRAMLYYDLTKAWGDVPARFESTTSETIYIGKSSRDVIYKQILADLEESFGYLPYPGKTEQTSRTDRINKAFAQGLYARIALAASGYALRPDDGAVGTGDAGTIRKSSDPELSADVLYPKALGYLKEVIASKSCSLEGDWANMWYKLNNMNNMVAGPSSETLYVIPFGEGRGRWNFTFAVNSEGSAYSGGVSRGGDVGPTPTFFFDYADNDIRRDITCVNYKWNKTNEPELAGIGKWYFGKYRFEWMDAQPYTGGNDDGIKPVVMRYADILLMAAEIENELNGPATAIEYFAPVHDRACGEGSSESLLAGADKETFFNAVVDERAFEFCGEFLRKADLIRWNLLKTKLDETREKMLKLRDREAPYDFLTGNVYTQLAEDEKSLVIYGLKRGEQDVPAGDWTLEADYFKYDDDKKPTEGMGADRVNGIYVNDPEQYMYWPIFQCNITDSQNALVNDYKY
ncbi:MAG: RagB/SusD family nutrient uptake outer membrane protein [Candidatus Cryptobacteroides sp.]